MERQGRHAEKPVMKVQDRRPQNYPGGDPSPANRLEAELGPALQNGSEGQIRGLGFETGPGGDFGLFSPLL